MSFTHWSLNRIFAGLSALTAGIWSVASEIPAYPFPTYESKVAVECASPAAARAAELKFLPLPPGKSVAFSCRWDDCNMANLRMKRLMHKYGYKGTFYITNPNPRFRKEVLPELCKDGCTIGNHTLNHINLGYLTPNGVFYQMLAARICHETLTNQTETAFIFPYGQEGNRFYPDAKDTIASCMRRLGVLGGPDNATYRLHKLHGYEFFSADGRHITPGDRNTSTKRFDDHVKYYLPKDGKTAHLTLGIHVWHSDKDFQQLEISLKKYANRPDWWYCNENEFLSYAYMLRYAKVMGKKVEGKNAVFTLSLPCPEYMGSTTPLWAECDGKNVKIEHRRSTPTQIDTAGTDGTAAKFPGLNAKLTFPAPNRARLEVSNSGAPLEDVHLALRLSPDFVEETRYLYVKSIADKFSKEWTLTAAPAGPSGGVRLNAVQMDFTRENAGGRIWLKHSQTNPHRDLPEVKVTFSPRQFTEAELVKLAQPGTEIAAAGFVPMINENYYRATMYGVPPKAANKESNTFIMDFTGGKKMYLRGELPDTVYCNGKELHPQKGSLYFDAPAGKCRIIFQKMKLKRPVRYIQLILTPDKAGK